MDYYYLKEAGSKWIVCAASIGGPSTPPPDNYTYVYPRTSRGREQAENQCRMLNATLGKDASGSQSSGSSDGCLVSGIFHLAWFLVKLPFRLIFAPYYAFTRRYGKKGGVIYFAVLGAFIWVLSAGPEVVGGYIASNWIYLALIASAIVAPIIAGKKFRRTPKTYKRNAGLATGAGLAVFFVTLCIGFQVTGHLAVVPERKLYSYVNVNELNLRSGPSGDDEVLAVLKEDARIQIVSDTGTGNWVKVKHNDIEGYVNKTYLRRFRLLGKTSNDKN